MTETPRRPRRDEPSDLDRTLDAVLREMVAGEGPPDLRRRVLARLGEARRRPPVAWPALAAAGIVVAVASIALLRTAPDRAPAASSAHPSVPAPSAVRPAEPPLPPPVVARTKPAAYTVQPAEPTRRDLPQQERWPLELEAETDVEPIELAPLAVVPISGEHIAVTALTIERMEIEPLAEPQP